MKRLFTFLGVALLLVWISLLFMLLFVSGLHPFDAGLPTTPPTPYKSGHVQDTGLFQGWYHVGNLQAGGHQAGGCIYIEQDTGCDIDG